MPKRPARKPTPEPHRPRRIPVFVTDAEHAELQARAERYTHGSLSAYLREAGLHRRMEPTPPLPPMINRDAYMSFLRVGALLNQAMHHLNSGNIWTTPQQLADFRRELAELRAAIGDVQRLLTRAS